MSVKEFIDVWRTLQEPTYAARLTKAQWRELFASPDWAEVAGEFPELAERFIANNQKLLSGHGLAVNNGGRSQANPSLAQADPDLTTIGQDHGYIQHLSIFNGTARYTENMVMPDMLWMKTLRSPHPRAVVQSIDASAAEALPGVEYVLHRFNLPEDLENSVLQGGPRPRRLFDEEVSQVGAPVVAVVAESEHIADEALHLIEVEYEVLPAVVNYLEGVLPSTAKQWENEYDGTITDISEEVRGDPQQAFADADLVVENVTSRGTEQNAPLELTSGLFWWDGDRLQVIWLPRYPHAERDRIAGALGLESTHVRLVQPGYVGSSYGSHRNADVSEVHAAILARITGRPVKAMMTRSEDFLMRTARAAETTESRLGINRDGTIVAAEYRTTSNTGAGSGNRSTGAWIGLETLYNIPNLRLEGIGVYTNSIRAGTFRCVSHPYATLAQETVLDKAAYEIGMDPVEIRLLNINEEGHPDSGRPYSNPGLRECITRVADAIGWSDNWHEPRAREVRSGVFHGIGLAAHTCSHGAGGHPSTGSVVIHTDGTVNVVSAAADIGNGQRTVLRMIAAETLGVPYERTAVAPGVDTALTSNTGGTFGSRQTNSGGWGIYEAAMDARQQILEGVARQINADRGITDAEISEEDAVEIGAAPSEDESESETTLETTQEAVTPDDLDIQDGIVFLKSDPEQSLELADALDTVVPNSPVIGRGAHFHPPTWERLAFAAHAAEVEVDTATGSVTVLRYVAAHDVGRALNPISVETQIEGGVNMGISAALFEDLFYDEATGLPISDNFLEYKVPSIHDVPRSIEVILVENPKEYGVYGAHGIGEPPLSVPPPTIANAIHNAIGAWVTDLPMTREKILAALA